MSYRSYPVPMWASDILDVLDREKVLRWADYSFHDSDSEFSKQANRDGAVQESNESGKRIWLWMPGWPSSRRRVSDNRQHVIFMAADEDELRGRLAVLEVMTS